MSPQVIRSRGGGGSKGVAGSAGCASLCVVVVVGGGAWMAYHAPFMHNMLIRPRCVNIDGKTALIWPTPLKTLGTLFPVSCRCHIYLLSNSHA